MNEETISVYDIMLNNWLLYKNEKEEIPFKVRRIFEGYVNAIGDNRPLFEDDLYGIPITNELLRKNGFRTTSYSPDTWVKQIEGVQVYIDRRTDYIIRIYRRTTIPICRCQIKYIHQMQNVYNIANIKEVVII